MVRFTLRLPDKVYHALTMRAAANRRSLNRQVVVELTEIEEGRRPMPVVILDMRESEVELSQDDIEDVIERLTEVGW